MRLERRLRDGQEYGSVTECQVGTFERHTKVRSMPNPLTSLPSYPFFLPPLAPTLLRALSLVFSLPFAGHWTEGDGATGLG